MKKKRIIGLIIFGIICLQQYSFGQDVRISGKSIPELKQAPLLPIVVLSSTFKLFDLSTPLLSSKHQPASNLEVAQSMPKAWAYEDLAFFCKLEVKMEKAARFPIKFRLGEVQYVERMEGKY